MEILQDITDISSPEGIPFRFRQFMKRLAAHCQTTAVRPQNSADQMQKRAFTGPAGSGNGYTLSFMNIPFRDIQNRYCSAVYSELFFQIPYLEQPGHPYLRRSRSDRESHFRVVPVS
ncbi:hypothetical protein D3C80_1501030 [compost metagenome]